MLTSKLTNGLLIAAAILLPGFTSAQWESEQINSGIYGTADDAITVPEARNHLLNLVNARRAEIQLLPLAADSVANELAAIRSDEIAAAGIASHYDADGRKIEQRMNLAGRTDHASENLVLYVIQAEIYLTPQLVERMLEHWLLEPNHRANILDPAHTGFGAGFSLISVAETGQSTISGATVFINDHGDCDRLPAAVTPGSHHWLTGYLAVNSAILAGISLGREDLESTRTPEDPLHYSMPEPAIVYLPPESEFETENGRPYLIHGLDYNPQNGYFSAELYIPAHWTGCRYYVSVIAETPSGHRFTAMTQVIDSLEISGDRS